MAIKPRVPFLCTENACRTQMAEAFLREMAGDELEIVSAGAEPGRLDPDAVAAMREVGIDISSARAKVIDPYLRERFHYVITLCERATERSCPIFPGAIWRQIWPVESPAALEAAGLDHYVRCVTRATRSAGTSASSLRNTIAPNEGRENQNGIERASTREIRPGRIAGPHWRKLLLRRVGGP